MVRGLYLRRSEAERLTVNAALDRYLQEVTPSKKATTQYSERNSAKTLKLFFAGYAMAAVNVELVGRYRDLRLQAGRANNTVRIELALLRHVFAVAIQDWGEQPRRVIEKAAPRPCTESATAWRRGTTCLRRNSPMEKSDAPLDHHDRDRNSDASI